MYQEWGILVGVGALLTFSGVPVYWLMRRPVDEVRTNKLEIKSLITTQFQELVIDEARSVLTLVDDHLPSALTRVNDPGGPSSFDRLAVGLREIDPEDPAPEPYLQVLEQSLSGLLSRQASILLDQAAESARRDLTSEESPTGLRVSLSGETENMLFALAEAASELDHKEHMFTVNQKILKWTVLGMGFTVVPATVGMLFDTGLAYTISIVSWILSLGFWAATLVFTARCYHGYQWLDEKAESFESGEALIADIT